MPLTDPRSGSPRVFLFDRCPLGPGDVALVTSRDIASDPTEPHLADGAFLRGAGLAASRLAYAGQVHGKRILALSRPGPQGSADALVTDRVGIVLSIRTADCVPVFFVDPARRTAGLAHSGWRGTHLGIAGDTVRALHRLYGTNPQDLWVGLGPAIGPCCYEVGRNVFDAFGGRHLEPRGDRWMLDMPRHIIDDLVASGVPEANIEASGECTACRPDAYVSYRAERSSARLFSLLGFESR
jgi:YfiH family protein